MVQYGKRGLRWLGLKAPAPGSEGPGGPGGPAGPGGPGRPS